MTVRKIIDIDAFYASVEQRDNPDLIGKPVAVGIACPNALQCSEAHDTSTPLQDKLSL